VQALQDAFCPAAIFRRVEVTAFGAAMASNDVAKVVAVPPPSFLSSSMLAAFS